METNKLVSFLILTYKNFDGIYETLRSLFEQDYPQIELIISDDGSPNYEEELPKLREYIEIHKKDNIIHVVYNHISPNKGTVHNINQAIKMAKGSYIKNLGADDVLTCKNALTKYVKFLENHSVDICFAKMRGITTEGKIVNKLASCEDNYKLLRSLTPEQTRNKLFARNFLPAPAWCAKKGLFEKYGYYPEEIRVIEDYPYWIHLCSENVQFGYLDDILIDYKLSGISSTGKYSMMFMKDMYKIYEKYIFPFDRRFGRVQFLYNKLKKMGLDAYYVKAEWENYNIIQKLKASIKYGIFFIYIWWGNYKYKKINEWSKKRYP